MKIANWGKIPIYPLQVHACMINLTGKDEVFIFASTLPNIWFGCREKKLCRLHFWVCEAHANPLHWDQLRQGLEMLV